MDAPPREGGTAAAKVVAFWDLPKQDPRSHELSGIAWDDRRQLLYAIADKTPQLIELVPDATFHRWRIGGQIAVSIPGRWDGEGLALTETGFLLSSEAGPHIYEVSRSGAWTATLPLPEHFQRSRLNLSLESLTLTADQRYLFTASEQALPADGPLATRRAGTVVRILRYDRSTGDQREFAYRTDPVFLGRGEGELGVADLAALSPQELLVMERSYVAGSGNSVRIYRVSTEGAPDILPVEPLQPGGAVLKKTLFLDLSTLPDDTFPAPAAAQPNKVLANFEAMALGPRLGPGQRLLFLLSDDNTGPTQLARLLVLVIADVTDAPSSSRARKSCSPPPMTRSPRSPPTLATPGRSSSTASSSARSDNPPGHGAPPIGGASGKSPEHIR